MGPEVLGESASSDKESFLKLASPIVLGTVVRKKSNIAILYILLSA